MASASNTAINYADRPSHLLVFVHTVEDLESDKLLQVCDGGLRRTADMLPAEFVQLGARTRQRNVDLE